MTLIVNGHAVNYAREGAGPVIVLIHGWGDSLKTFDGLNNGLKKNYDVIRLDLLGFGGSDMPNGVYNLEKYALFVKSFLDKLGVSQVYAYVGHSNGGAVAIRGIAGGLLKSEKLILIASSGIRSEYQSRKKALRIVAKAAKLPTAVLPKNLQKRIKKKAYETIGSDLFVSEKMQETFKAVITEDVLQESAMVHIPTLMIYGSDDTATPPRFGELFANQIEDSNLIIINQAGHFVHQDKLENVQAEIERFLE